MSDIMRIEKTTEMVRPGTFGGYVEVSHVAENVDNEFITERLEIAIYPEDQGVTTTRITIGGLADISTNSLLKIARVLDKIAFQAEPKVAAMYEELNLIQEQANAK